MTDAAEAPVLVTGATGRVGRSVVDLLLAAGVPVRALVRPDSPVALPAGAQVVAGDLTRPASLDPALRGARAVFLVWMAPPDGIPGAVERIAAHGARVVLLSAPFRTPHPFFAQPNPMADLLADLESRLAAAGIPTTTLRPGMFASNALGWWAPTIRDGGPVRWPWAAVETAPVDDRDVAEVAAGILARTIPDGGDHVLTGPEALTQAAQVATIGRVLGRRVPFEEITPDAFRAATAGTWPAPAVEMLLAAWEAASGHPAYVTSEVTELLGRPARTFGSWVSDHADAFRLPG